MKKKTIFILLFIILFIPFHTISFASVNEPTNLSCGAAILMDSKTNKILFSKNEQQKMYPASITKIMTAIVTLENCSLNDKVIVSYDAIASIPQGYSTADLQVGEELTVEQLLQVLLVYSANDSANVLAEYVGGSIESFVSMMNTKANELNLQNTHFTNTYGMHDNNHYTTAYDLALLMQYCIKDENFRKIAGSASCAIPATNKSGTRLYNSTNELLIPNAKSYYSYVTAGKTGYTSQAKNCLVSVAYKNDLELICVVLGADDSNGSSSRFSESKQLFEYGFQNYSLQTIFHKGDIATNIEVNNGTKDTKNLDLLISDNISALLKNDELSSDLNPEIKLDENINAPIKEGDVIGEISYIIGEDTYHSNLIASHDVEKSQFLQLALYIGIGILLFLILISFFSNKKA